uniref:Uncharacterized protein n=1 Tax=Candidozyma auris TaxID=498019 RepID=A0A0L0NZD8_CANAR
MWMAPLSKLCKSLIVDLYLGTLVTLSLYYLIRPGEIWWVLALRRLSLRLAVLMPLLRTAGGTAQMFQLPNSPVDMDVITLICGFWQRPRIQ